jgi:hypothetical protein
MKSAEDWAVTFIDESTQYEMASLFRDIQLDAFKAGAEWASKQLGVERTMEISNLKEIPK